MLFDMPITCTINDGRYINPLNCDSYTTAREIWQKAPRAAARKATAEGVNHIAIDASGEKWFIYQVGGYTSDRGIYCDLLNEHGQIVKTY